MSKLLSGKLLSGLAIPALPLALDNDGQWSIKHQKALIRYYHAAGAGGIAVGVHSTQFEIREPEFLLLEPILKLTMDELEKLELKTDQTRKMVRIAGVCGLLDQAMSEAKIAAELGYDAVLLSLAALKGQSNDQKINHCRQVSKILPVVGFYLQPAVGGEVLDYDFWKKFCDIPDVVAIKMAPFNRYQTSEVVRAVHDSGRTDIALYTGNDDNIIGDLLTTWNFGERSLRISGGLLGQFGVWTHNASKMLRKILDDREFANVSADWHRLNADLTDANAAIFDAANGFAGCIPGIHEILRRQGLLCSTRCLNPQEVLSEGQARELDRVCRLYPHLTDDEFVANHLEEWLSD